MLQPAVSLLRSVVPLRVRQWAPRLLPGPVWDYVWGEYLAAGRPDRRYLTDTLLPALADAGFRRVLFVGCRRYTRHYGAPFTRRGVEYWTTDVDPAAARWGEEGRHFTCDVQEVDRSAPVAPFDLVLLTGVFGSGVDTPEAMNRTLRSVSRVMPPEGVLLLGWNTDRMADPLSLAEVERSFRHGAGLPLASRVTFEQGTHVYDLLTHRPVSPEH